MDIFSEKNTIDGLEVFVKEKIGISLTNDELKLYNSYDNEEKNLINEFIDNPLFKSDLDKIIENINTKEKEIKSK